MYLAGSNEGNYLPMILVSFSFTIRSINIIISIVNVYQFEFDTRFSFTRSGDQFLQIDVNIEGRLMLFGDLNFICKFFIHDSRYYLSMD